MKGDIHSPLLKKRYDVNIRKRNIKKFRSNYMFILILFIIIMTCLLGMRKVFLNFSDKTDIIIRNSRVREFNSILKSTKYIANYELESSIEKINHDVEKDVDLNKLKYSLSNNVNYPEFDEILRNRLSNNIFIANGLVDINRNNIFVMANGYIIASYNHDDSYLKNPIQTGSKIKMRDIIEKEFYNKDLGLLALHQLQTQYKGLIVWQSIKPYDANNDYVMPKKVDINKLDDILINGTIDELSSYEILIAKYITENGNIFGDYDVAGCPKDINNKIIIVQKINIVDWIEYYYPDFFDSDVTDTVTYNYNQVTNIINFFIIITCVAMIGYALGFIFVYNNSANDEDN